MFEQPTSSEEVATLVRQAGESGDTLRPIGVQTTSWTVRDGLRYVDLQKMSSVVEYPSKDMTITVQAGMTLDELRNILAENNQQLPVDAWNSTTTVGALVAGNFFGPRQYGYGTIRDYLIGIEAVEGQGRVFHAGGRVVKNVAGYDLCRLLTGSRGALGIITQVTFKLKPKPAQGRMRTWRFDDDKTLEEALNRLNNSNATPVVLDFLYAAPELAAQRESDSDRNDLPYSVSIGVEGSDDVVAWQFDQLRQDCVGGEEIELGDGPGSSIDHHCKSYGYDWNGYDIVIRTLPSKVVPLARKLAERGYSSQGYAGSGILCVAPSSADDSGTARSVCNSLAQEFVATVSQWDEDHPANNQDAISKRLRAAFDPHGVFAR